MSQFSDAAKSIISTVAPLLGTAIGGPLGGLAGGLISKALGGTSGNADPKAIEKLILGQDPQTLIALRAAEAELQIHMKELEIGEEKLSFDDIASARAREVAVKDWMPGALSLIVTFGFFGVLSYMMTNLVPVASRDTLNIMLGSLGTAWIAIISYYFGSSAGSRAKDQTIGNMSK